jgi:hypothetical protein
MTRELFPLYNIPVPVCVEGQDIVFWNSPSCPAMFLVPPSQCGGGFPFRDLTKVTDFPSSSFTSPPRSFSRPPRATLVHCIRRFRRSRLETLTNHFSVSRAGSTNLMGKSKKWLTKQRKVYRIGGSNMRWVCWGKYSC